MVHHHHHHDHGSQIDPEAELQLAVELMDGGDHAHAAHHLGLPAAHNPHGLRLHEAIARLCREVDEPLALVPLPDPPDLGAVVLRGMIAVHCGRLGEALDLLLRAELSAAEPGYLDVWSVAPASEAALEAVDADAIGGRIARLATSSDELDEPQRSATRERAAVLVDTLLPHHRRSETLVYAAATLYQRLQREDEAIELARAFLAHTPSYRLQLALAYALRECGEYEEAAEAYGAAQALEPNETAVSLDLGDMYGSIGRLEEAVEAYGNVLDREPDQPWASSSWHYYRWLLDGDPGDAEALARLAEDPDNTRARALYEKTTAYDESLPPRRESLLRAFEQGGPLERCAVSSLEAPSAVAVARLLAPGIEIEMGDAEGVDPRVPRRKVNRVLWRYRQRGMWPRRELTNEAEPVVDALRPDVSAALAELARAPYSARAWYQAAGQLATQLGPSAIDAVCAAMVGVAEAPARSALQDWTFRVQVAGALVLAQMPDGEQVLWDIVYGPVDWVSSAALTALAQLAIERPARRAAIENELLAQIDGVANPIGYLCISLPAAINLMRVPGVSLQTQQRARELRNDDIRG
jgi:tetratricopeptide (TPR) repeat protein